MLSKFFVRCKMEAATRVDCFCSMENGGKQFAAFQQTKKINCQFVQGNKISVARTREIYFFFF